MRSEVSKTERYWLTALVSFASAILLWVIL